jgi:hypothetical protein
MSEINFFQVSLKENVPIILQNYFNLKKIYKSFTLTLICRDNEVKFFKKSLKLPGVKIIKESFLITLPAFTHLFNRHCKNKIFLKQNDWRISWYYQQCLKILYIFHFFKKIKTNNFNTKKLVLWDADSLILNKINFFTNNQSNIFCCPFQLHKDYYKTLLFIFKKLPPYYLSGTCQFSPISEKDFSNLCFNLNSFLLKKISLENWLVTVMGKSIFTAHKSYSNSLFSEQDLLTINKLLYDLKKQEPILYFRSNLGGKLNSFQIKILKFMNFKHLTYDFYGKIYDKEANSFKFVIKLFQFTLHYYFKCVYNNCFYYIKVRKKFTFR